MEPEWNNNPENDDVAFLGLRPYQFTSQISMSLDNDIDCNKLCSDIARYISNYNKINGHSQGRLMTISIKETIPDDSHIKKIELKNE